MLALRSWRVNDQVSMEKFPNVGRNNCFSSNTFKLGPCFYLTFRLAHPLEHEGASSALQNSTRPGSFDHGFILGYTGAY